jgi:hypothetical protein
LDSYYANILAYRVTAHEFVLEFGDFFAGQGNRTEADFDDFGIRIVMIPELIEPLMNLLEQAKIARDKQRAELIASTEKRGK